MPTPLTKPVAREIAVLAARGQTTMVVTLTEAGITFRLKGTRTSYLLPYGVAYTRAAMLEADHRRAEKRRPVRRVSRGLLATERAS